MEQKADNYFQSGLEKLRNSDLDGALADLDKAIEINSHNAKYFLERGMIRYDSREYMLASQDFARVQEVTKNPDDLALAKASRADCYFQLARDKFRQREWKRALQFLDMAISFDPENPTYYLERGEHRYFSDQFELAFEDFTKAVEYGRDLQELADAHRMKASCYICDLSIGYPDEFLADLNWLVDNGFGDERAYRDRGSYKESLWQFEDAIQDFTKAYKIAPTDWNLLQRTRNYYFAKHYENALADFTKLIESIDSRPDDLAEYFEWRGSTYYMIGDEQKAFEDFNEAMRLFASLPYLAYTDVRSLYDASRSTLIFMGLRNLPRKPHKRLRNTDRKRSIPTFGTRNDLKKMKSKSPRKKR